MLDPLDGFLVLHIKLTDSVCEFQGLNTVAANDADTVLGFLVPVLNLIEEQF